MVRVRMAPSPTGRLHLGTAYTTFFNFLFARKNKGTFILRIEDTDQVRSKKEFEENILAGLEWLGLYWDEGPYREMERLELYQKASQKLLEEGKAYYCFCTPEELEDERKLLQAGNLPQVYSGRCRNLSAQEVEDYKNQGKPYVIRFKMPQDRGKIAFGDLIHGEVSFEAKLIGDFVINRSTGIPLYNFAVVVDDIDMKITHVLRGEDHLSNTPKQIVLFEALGASLPEYAHWPSILNPDRIGKLSKRTGATSVDDYRQAGYLPEAILNYLSLLGWSLPDEKEIISLEEMEKTFDIAKMRKSAAAFDPDKLDWLNGKYIRQMSDEELTKRLQDFLVDHPNKDKIAPVVPMIKERITKLSDFVPLTDFLFGKPEYDVETFKKLKIQDTSGGIKGVLEGVVKSLADLPKPWTSSSFEQTVRSVAKELNVPDPDLFQLVRIAVSGQTVTPPLFESIEIMGEERALERLKWVSQNYPNF